MRPLLVLVLAFAASAADYPASAGFVNDLPGILPEAVQQALELRLRAYERATSNEVAVAIVPSLQGETVEQYAQGLFRAWGLGKAEKNNGVLFLWAPSERKVRIQVGYGLESVLTDAECAAILARVTPLFREEQYAEGVRTAVDAILQRIGNATPSQPETEIPAKPNFVGIFVGAVFLAIVVALLFMHHHTTRTHQLQAEVPEALASSREALQRALGETRDASGALNSLRAEAPAEVWAAYEKPVEAAPDEFENLRLELARIESQRREEYRELASASRSLGHWKKSLEKRRKVYADLAALRCRVDESRDYAMECIPRLSVSLGKLAAPEPDKRRESLRRAASQTFENASILRSRPPVNWLLVRDLLEDANCCLACLEQEGSAPMPERGDRYWPESHKSSPACDQLTAMLAASQVTMAADASSPAGFDGGGSSFGGGDSGDGGASAGY
jgi:uncharacterized protein